MRSSWTGWWLGLLAMLLATVAWAAESPSTTSPAKSSQAEIRRQLRPFLHLAVNAESPLAIEHGAIALRDAYGAFLSTLGACSTSDDLEVRVRARDVLEKVVLSTRLQRVEALLPEELVEKFAEFRRCYPEKAEDIFSRDLDRQILVLRQMESQKDPRGLYEPILAICMKHSSEALRAWAMAAGVKKQYRSDMFAEAVCDLIRHAMAVRQSLYLIYQDEEDADSANETPPNVLSTAFEALRVIQPPAAGKKLLAILDQQNEYNVENRLYLAEAIGSLRDTSMIPLLMERLKIEPQSKSPQNYKGLPIEFACGDDALLAILRLTGQSPDQYQLLAQSDPEEYNSTLGFKTPKQRKKAYAKIRTWWKANRNRPPYRQAEPASQPAETQPAVVATTNPAANPPAAEEPFPTTRQARQLRRSVAAETQRWTRQLASENYDHRVQACNELLALHDAIFSEVLAGIRTASPQQRRMQLMLAEDMIVSSRIEQFLYDQSAEDLAAIEVIRATHPKAYRDFFSLSSTQRKKALNTLSANDPLAQASPFVAAAMETPDDETMPAVLLLLESGRYRSRKIQLLLAETISQRLYQQLLTEGRVISPRDDKSIYSHWIQALGAVGGTESVRVLVSMFDLDQWQVRYSYDTVVEAIVRANKPQAVEWLIPLLGKTDRLYDLDVQNKKITRTKADFALMAILRLTKQDPKAYGFVYYPIAITPGVMPYGFFDKKDRQAAIDKFFAWQREQDKPATQPAK